MNWMFPTTRDLHNRASALRKAALVCLLGLASACTGLPPNEAPIPTGPYLVVLGIAQDGGVPQLGSSASRPAGNNRACRDTIFLGLCADELLMRRLVVSLALVDAKTQARWLFEATPDIKEQLQRLNLIAPIPQPAPGLAGIFLTHAHMGHYLGLAQLGHEALGAQDVPVYVMPRMGAYLSSNGPWDQLVKKRNIKLMPLSDGQAVQLNPRLTVTPIRVPHRQEYSEVVGFIIAGAARRVLFIPDIDSWEEWDAEGTRIEDLIASVDVAYLDATFYADGEIPGRDMSGFPHPFITHSMQRFESLPARERAKVRFIHLNHTNPALQADSPARRVIERAGFKVAEEGERVGL